jgi:hypothetical protein
MTDRVCMACCGGGGSEAAISAGATCEQGIEIVLVGVDANEVGRDLGETELARGEPVGGGNHAGVGVVGEV